MSFTFDRLAATIEVGHEGETKPLVAALDEAIDKVAAAVDTAGAKGSLTLRVDFKPKGRGALIISAAIKTNTPEPGAFPVQAFVDRFGKLVAEDPDQGKLPLTSIDPARTVGQEG